MGKKSSSATKKHEKERSATGAKAAQTAAWKELLKFLGALQQSKDTSAARTEQPIERIGSRTNACKRKG